MPDETIRTAFRTCPLCEATCGLEITLQSGRAVKVTGDKADVFSRGYLCPKGAALGELHHDPERLRRPLVRQGGEFREVGWDEAFAAVEEGLAPILEKGGRDAVAVYLGNPCSHTLAGALCMKPLLKALGSKSVYTASTVDQMPKHVSSGFMFGAPMTIPVPDVDRTGFLLILGADPCQSNGSLATAPDWPGRLRALKARGGRVVVVDPRRSRTAKLAGEHLAIRPGGDAFLLMALVNVIFAEGLQRPGRLAEMTNGMDELRELARPFTPQAVAGACGLAAEDITALARDLAEADSACVYGRMGVSTNPFGAAANWLVDALNLITGNLDRPGGAMFPTPAHLPVQKKPGGKGWRVGRWASRVGSVPEIMGEFPACELCPEMETPGPGQVRGLITVASNPVIGLPNAARVDAALAGLDFMVSVDFYVNASTRHAHVILPPTGPLTTSHYDVNFYNLSVRNIARYSPPVLPKPAGEMDKWEILYRLALIAAGQGAAVPASALDSHVGELLKAKACREGSPLAGREAEVGQALGKYQGAERILELMLRTGPHGDGFGLNPEGLTLEKLAQATHGLDLGPLTPRLPDILRTPSGKVELAPEPLAAQVERMRAALGAAPPQGLALVGRRHLRTNNSWMANIPSLVSGPPRCTVQVHPDDAARLGLTHGGSARAASRVGEIVLAVEVTEDVRPGVVSIPHGWGHDLDGVAMGVARSHGGVNVNLLHDDAVRDELSQTSVLNGTPVSLTPA